MDLITWTSGMNWEIAVQGSTWTKQGAMLGLSLAVGQEIEEVCCKFECFTEV